MAARKPKAGEESKAQVLQPAVSTRCSGGVYAMIGSGAALVAPPPGVYETYREMRRNPTIKLARSVTRMPIVTASVPLQTRDDSVPEAWKEFIAENLDTLWPRFVREALFALDYGWAAFEKVFEIEGGRYRLAKLKYLLPEKTKIILTKADGSFAGLKQGETTIEPERALVFSHDKEGDNYYGESVLEGIRETAWWPWVQKRQKQLQYMTKVAAVTPMIEYPPGESDDGSGATQSNEALATAVLRNLGNAKGVAFPNSIMSYLQNVPMAMQTQSVDALRAWRISFLETKESHGAEFDASIAHDESLMARGYLVPERAVLEGQKGTLAEAEAHAGLAEQASSMILQDIVDHWNRYVVDQLLVLNFGEEAKGACFYQRESLDTATRSFYRALVMAVLSQPANTDLFMDWLLVDELLDAAALPRKDKMADVGEDRTPRRTSTSGEVAEAVGAANAR